MNSLDVVVPVYNEAENLPDFYQEVSKHVEGLGLATRFIFVNDGSGDDSLEVLKNLAKENGNVFYL
ncbi:MAG: glycosyltransferase, partial [Enterococcus sp.]|nr:glycosyltransferase [Enterococcus sp.]